MTSADKHPRIPVSSVQTKSCEVDVRVTGRKRGVRSWQDAVLPHPEPPNEKECVKTANRNPDAPVHFCLIHRYYKGLRLSFGPSHECGSHSNVYSLTGRPLEAVPFVIRCQDGLCVESSVGEATLSLLLASKFLIFLSGDNKGPYWKSKVC